MLRLAKTSAALLLAFAALDAAPAAANPEVRDHRAPEARPTTTTVVDADRPPPQRYRRRRGPKIMMPLKLDIGVTGANTTQGYLPGIELRAGIHWASLSPKPTDFDIGVGGFIAALAGPEDESMPEADNDVVYGGAYLEVGQTLSKGRFWRTWASGRGEYLGSSTFGETQEGFGVAGRLSAELYVSGVGIEPRGVFLGTYAVGVYAEAAGRGLGDDVSALQVSGGLTFRTPLVFMP
jgi:hypothetical protein